MATPSFRRLAKVVLPAASALRPDVLDETVVHDPTGRPWLVCTTDTRYAPDAAEPPEPDDAGAPAARYETQVYYSARAGIRGFPTGHGERYLDRAAAVAGHRAWCLRVRTGEVEPDRVPPDPL